jgi:protein-S-isoprenylcysteine O-methyltransferase Ste14
VALFGRRSRDASTATGDDVTRRSRDRSSFLPARSRRPTIESLFMRVVATGGIVGIGTALAAILGTQEVDAWIVGLVVSVVSVVLAAILWSSRTL